MLEIVSSDAWVDRAKKATFETKPFINGDYSQPTGSDIFETENPANCEKLAVFTSGDVSDIDSAVVAARKAFRNGWQQLAPEKRKALLLAVANQVELERETLALLDCLEMGMPISMALEQVDGAISFLRFNAELADKIYGEIAPANTATTLAMSIKQPRGVVGVISPWNFPLLTAMIAIAPRASNR